MTRTLKFATRLAALTVSLAAAGSAFADDPTVVPPQPASPTLTRAAVSLQYLQARAAGRLDRTEADRYRSERIEEPRSRADVKAETLAAIASGEILAMGAEPSTFGNPFQPARRPVVLTIMASSTR